MPDPDAGNTGAVLPPNQPQGSPPPAVPDAAAGLGTSQPLPPSTFGATTPADVRLEQLKSQSYGAKVYHGILNALGGSNDVSYSIDPATGKMVQSVAASGPGTQWKRIISGALTGYAAGAGMKGPGSTAAKAGAGIQAGQQQAQQQDQQKRQQATEDFEREQKLATSNLQNSLLAHNIARATYDLEQEKMTATEAEISRYSEWQKMIGAGGQGSQMIGEYPTLKDAYDALNNNPQLHDHLVKGEISMMPRVENGEIKGISAAIVTPNWLQSKYNEDLHIKIPDPAHTDKDGKPLMMDRLIPKGSISNDDANKILMGQGAQAMADRRQDAAEKHQEHIEDIGERRAGAAERTAAAAEERAGTAKEKADEAAGNFGAPSAAGTFDPAYPPPQNFPKNTAGIVPKQIGKVPAVVQKNADLARLIEHNTQHALQIIHDHGAELQGAITGRESELKEWAGSDNQYLRMLAQDIENIAMPTTGIHGTRSQKLVDKEGKILFNDFRAGPNAVAATLLANLGSARTYLTEEKNFLHYGTAVGPDRKLQINTPAAPPPAPGNTQAAPQQAPATPTPSPQTHVWSKSTWQVSHPGQDANAAEAAARQKNYQVTP